MNSLLRAASIMLILTGLLAVIAANRETPILGRGMIPAGILLLLARSGAKRAWRGFPTIPLIAAGLIAAATAWAFHVHMEEISVQSTERH